MRRSRQPLRNLSRALSLALALGAAPGLLLSGPVPARADDPAPVPKRRPASPAAKQPAKPATKPAPKLTPEQQRAAQEKRAKLARQYSACMAMARSDPAKAFDKAEQWEKQGGDDAARHCMAVALLNQGDYAGAADRLEKLAATVKGEGPKLRGELYAQAGQAWLIGGNLDRALAAQTRAIETAGKRTDLLIDRAITYGSLGKYWDAIDDLNVVIDKDHGNADALVYRATAWRKLRHYDLALDDISRATFIAPHDPDALLERGIVRRLKGDDAGAEKDWKEVVKIDPKSPAADAARENLELLSKDRAKKR